MNYYYDYNFVKMISLHSVAIKLNPSLLEG